MLMRSRYSSKYCSNQIRNITSQLYQFKFWLSGSAYFGEIFTLKNPIKNGLGTWTSADGKTTKTGLWDGDKF